MSLLDASAEVLEDKLPGLAEDLAKIGLDELESDSGRGVASFKARGGPGLLVPSRHGGVGVTALEAVHCVRGLGALAPSLAVATTMHNFSVAALVSVEDNFDGFEWMILDAIANDRLLMSSAFAEGLSGQGFLTPTVRADKVDGGWRLNGSKKPCSLSRSMDLMSASIALHDGTGAEPEMGLVVLAATLDGISVRPFWDAPVLRGAESDEVVLTDVEVPDELVIKPQDNATGLSVDAVEAKGLVWFTLLITSAYLGMADALVRKLFETGKGTSAERTSAACELQSAGMALERVAVLVERENAGQDVLPLALAARYTAQGSIRRAVATAVEVLGGMRFIKDPMVGYLAAATNALAFHPPSRHAVVDELEKAFLGGRMSFA
jgi:alkylation response protein AidB-like acyl-CoA dehydrogenase